jgi:hypothetical protein
VNLVVSEAVATILFQLGIGGILSVLRIPLLEYRPGSESAAVMLIALILALGISYRDFR